MVIGRGFAGLALGLDLLQKGHKVRIIGRGSLSPRDPTIPLSPIASAAAVGISSIKGHFLAESSLFNLKLQGHLGLIDWIQNLERISKKTISKFVGSVFEPFWDNREFVYLHERIFHANPTGLYRNRVVDEKYIRERFRFVFKEPYPLGSFEFFEDLWFSPVECLEALECAILMLGGEILDGHVTEIHDARDGVFCAGYLGSIDRHFQEVTWQVDQLVIAAGAATQDVLRNFGLNVPLPLVLCSGSTAVFDWYLPDKHQSWSIRHRKTNIVQVNNELIVGSSSNNQQGDQLQKLYSTLEISENEAYKEKSLETLKNLFKSESLAFKRCLWGVRLRAKDRYPILGCFSDVTSSCENQSLTLQKENLNKRIWIFTGLYKNGLQISWLLAKKMATAITNANTDILPYEISLKRFFGLKNSD